MMYGQQSIVRTMRYQITDRIDHIAHAGSARNRQPTRSRFRENAGPPRHFSPRPHSDESGYARNRQRARPATFSPARILTGLRGIRLDPRSSDAQNRFQEDDGRQTAGEHHPWKHQLLKSVSQDRVGSKKSNEHFGR